MALCRDRSRSVAIRRRRARDEVDGYEEIRPITDQGDAFEPPFELDTDEHAEWVRNAIAEFE